MSTQQLTALVRIGQVAYPSLLSPDADRLGQTRSFSELLVFAVGGVRATEDNCTESDQTCEIYS
jgi:hypothetical protein